MNILHLKYAVEVANAGSISKAAAALYMNQPNLSRAIRELEDSLGITIFDRSAKGMKVTPRGREFLGYAEKILKQIDEVEALYTKKYDLKQIFSVSGPRSSYISEAFASFASKINHNKHFELFYKETNSMHVIENILHADYKLGIIRYSADYDKYFKEMLEEKGLTYELISEFNYQIIMSQNHRLADKEKIHFSDLSEYTEIIHADASIPSLSMSAAKKNEFPDSVNKKIYVFERAGQYDILSADTNSFMWVSPPSDTLLKRYALVKKACADSQTVYRDLLIHRNEYKLSELDSIFITELCAAKRRCISANP